MLPLTTLYKSQNLRDSSSSPPPPMALQLNADFHLFNGLLQSAQCLASSVCTHELHLPWTEHRWMIFGSRTDRPWTLPGSCTFVPFPGWKPAGPWRRPRVRISNAVGPSWRVLRNVVLTGVHPLMDEWKLALVAPQWSSWTLLVAG
jgi:hypothetical protein